MPENLKVFLCVALRLIAGANVDKLLICLHFSMLILNLEDLKKHIKDNHLTS